VRLARWRERRLDADVQLAAIGQLEPDAAARAQRRRLGQLDQAEQLAVEGARSLLAGRRRGDRAESRDGNSAGNVGRLSRAQAGGHSGIGPAGAGAACPAPAISAHRYDLMWL